MASSTHEGVAIAQRVRLAWRQNAGSFVHPDFSNATLHLVVQVVSGTVLQIVLNPPKDIPDEALLSELSRRVDGWIRRPAE